MSTDETNIRCSICRETVPQGYLLCPFCGADLTTTYETKIFAPVTWRDVWRRIRLLLTRPREIFEEIADNPDSDLTNNQASAALVARLAIPALGPITLVLLLVALASAGVFLIRRQRKSNI